MTKAENIMVKLGAAGKASAKYISSFGKGGKRSGKAGVQVARYAKKRSKRKEEIIKRYLAKYRFAK